MTGFCKVNNAPSSECQLHNLHCQSPKCYVQEEPTTTNTMNSEIAPCPFCGSADIDPKGWQSTESCGPACDDCGASAGAIGETLEANIAAWNTRQPPSDAMRITQLEKTLEGVVLAIKQGNIYEPMCCSGHDCGCRASSHADLMLHDIEAALTQGKPEL